MDNFWNHTMLTSESYDNSHSEIECHGYGQD